jgi:hypothetical protein
MIHKFKVSPAIIDKLHAKGSLALSKLELTTDKDIITNDALLLTAGQQSAISIFDGTH